jgi:hypothetical protein
MAVWAGPAPVSAVAAARAVIQGSLPCGESVVTLVTVVMVSPAVVMAVLVAVVV